MASLNVCMRNMLIIACAMILPACVVGPDYKRPSVDTPTKFKEAKNKMVITSAMRHQKWKVAKPSDDFDRGEWWRVFHDKDLNALEAQLNASNQSIIQAEANYRQAMALVDEARASYFPTLNGSLALTRQKGTGSSSFVSSSSTGTTSSGTATSSSSAGTTIFSSHSWLLNATWEPDIWGLVRRTVEASKAGAESTGALLAVTQLSSQASLAQFYFELRNVDADQKFLDDTVKSYNAFLKFTRNQYRSGVASRANILQAQSQLETAKALAINNGVNRAVYEHAIAVLVGTPPETFSMRFEPLHQAPPPIPLTVPSELLERRPDIAQAERSMAQANAQIGVAIAAYFPTLPLTASLTSSARNAGLTQLFQYPSVGWSYGPQLAQLIYDGGLRSATVIAARAGYDSTVANYRGVVLAAFQSVEDNLASLRILNEQAVQQDAAAVTAKRALQLIINEYKSGIVDYSSVLTAQVNAFAAEKSAIDVTGLRMTAAVGLIKALGGGWRDNI